MNVSDAQFRIIMKKHSKLNNLHATGISSIIMTFVAMGLSIIFLWLDFQLLSTITLAFGIIFAVAFIYIFGWKWSNKAYHDIQNYYIEQNEKKGLNYDEGGKDYEGDKLSTRRRGNAK